MKGAVGKMWFKIISKIIFKLKLNRLFLYMFYFVKKILSHSKELPALDEAKKTLDNFRKNPKSSCFRDCEASDRPAAYDLDIIVPCYNVEQYLKQCLDSLLLQTTQYKYRIICIDDGSTDNTGDILDRYSSENSNITVIHQSNKGLSGARNAGIDLIDSRYVMFVDSDDYIVSDAVGSMLKAAYENDAAIVQGGYVRVTEDGRIIKRVRQKEGMLSIRELTGFPCMKIIKSDYIKSIYFPLDYYYEDSVMSMIVFALIEKNNAKVYGVDKIIYYYRYNPKGIYQTAKISPKSIDTLYITDQLHKDRNLYGISNSRHYYEFILYTIRLNYARTRTLPENINKAVFVMFSDFLNANFKDYLTEKTMLEKSFIEQNYILYISACNFEV